MEVCVITFTHFGRFGIEERRAGFDSHLLLDSADLQLEILLRHLLNLQGEIFRHGGAEPLGAGFDRVHAGFEQRDGVM